MSVLRICCCITSHGFGHAARAMAVMEALAEMTDLRLTVVSTVLEWFLRSSFAGSMTIHALPTDVGLVQRTALEEDLEATLSALDAFYPVREETLAPVVDIVAGCDLVLCDIAPLGILAAREAKVPSVLLENFTWDWIYEPYRSSCPGITPFIDYLAGIYETADYRVRTIPVCGEAQADLTVSPVARSFRESPRRVRERFGVLTGQRMVLVSMGGIGMQQLPLNDMHRMEDVVLLISGYRGDEPPGRFFNLRIIPADEVVHHPDLVRAADAVIGKVGYSTLAETYHAGVPFGYVQRPGFRESEPLSEFIEREMASMEIEPEAFASGSWPAVVPHLLRMTGGREQRRRQNGAFEAARFLCSLANRTGEKASNGNLS
ncbi:MAG: hypothetical protein Kow0089_00060 [Desulfobulbaceae bacterium]